MYFSSIGRRMWSRKLYTAKNINMNKIMLPLISLIIYRSQWDSLLSITIGVLLCYIAKIRVNSGN